MFLWWWPHSSHAQGGREGAFLWSSSPLAAVWWQLLEWFDSWHPTRHPGFMLRQGDCNPLFKVPVKKSSMNIGHSVALVNVYCYSDRVLPGIVTFVRPELQAGRHKYPGEGCSRCTHSLHWDLAARMCSIGEHPPHWDFWVDMRIQRDLPMQVLVSAHCLEKSWKEKRKMRKTCRAVEEALGWQTGWFNFVLSLLAVTPAAPDSDHSPRKTQFTIHIEEAILQRLRKAFFSHLCMYWSHVRLSREQK